MSLKVGNFSLQARTAQNRLRMGKYGTYLEFCRSHEAPKHCQLTSIRSQAGNLSTISLAKTPPTPTIRYLKVLGRCWRCLLIKTIIRWGCWTWSPTAPPPPTTQAATRRASAATSSPPSPSRRWSSSTTSTPRRGWRQPSAGQTSVRASGQAKI